MTSRERAEYGQTERTPSEKVVSQILIEEGMYQYDMRSERVIKRIAAAIDKAVAEAFEEAARDCDYAQCDRLAERIRERARKEKL